MSVPSRLYLVRHNDKTLRIYARSQAEARNFVAKGQIEVTVATVKSVAALVAAGTKVQDATTADAEA